MHTFATRAKGFVYYRVIGNLKKRHNNEMDDTNYITNWTDCL